MGVNSFIGGAGGRELFVGGAGGREQFCRRGLN